MEHSAVRGDPSGARGGVDDAVDDRVIVGEPDEDRLVGPGSEGDTLGQHRVEETGVGRLIGGLRGGEVGGLDGWRRTVPLARIDDVLRGALSLLDLSR